LGDVFDVLGVLNLHCITPRGHYSLKSKQGNKSSPVRSKTNLLGLAWLGLGMAWLGLAWVGLSWLGLALVGLGWPGLAWLGLAWHGLGWLALAGLGFAWVGLAWPGLAWSSFACLQAELLSYFLAEILQECLAELLI
jgi:hypothetical protein